MYQVTIKQTTHSQVERTFFCWVWIFKSIWRNLTMVHVS